MTGWFFCLPPIKLHRNWIPNGAQKPSISTLYTKSTMVIIVIIVYKTTHGMKKSKCKYTILANRESWRDVYDSMRRRAKKAFVFWIRINKFRYASKFSYLDHIHIHVSCYKQILFPQFLPCAVFRINKKNVPHHKYCELHWIYVGMSGYFYFFYVFFCHSFEKLEWNWMKTIRPI